MARQISIPDPSAVLISRAGQYKRALWVAGPPGREKPLTTLSYTGPKEPERYSTNSKNFQPTQKIFHQIFMTYTNCPNNQNGHVSEDLHTYQDIREDLETDRKEAIEFLAQLKTMYQMNVKNSGIREALKDVHTTLNITKPSEYYEDNIAVVYDELYTLNKQFYKSKTNAEIIKLIEGEEEYIIFPHLHFEKLL